MSHPKYSTLESINRSALNTSKSKAMFTFTKANRFMEEKAASSSFYQKPSSLDRRATSFGYGSKWSLTNKYINTPSPDRYVKGSEFQPSPIKGITMGLGRGDCKNVSIFNATKYPAPTDYNCKDNKENSAAYSMRTKVKLPELFPQKLTPGPGKYSTQVIDKNGFSFQSKYKSSVSFKICNESPRVLEKTSYPSLGPLTYHTELPANGKQILSKKRTQKSFVFDKKPRVTMHVDSSSPGPGSYGFFSEFNR